MSFLHFFWGAESAQSRAVSGLLLLILLVCAAGLDAAPVQNRPNFLLILADDLGYGDVSCYNPDKGKIPTPNIDRLMAEGMRFTDAHSSSAVCSPSRYSLLTGRYHWRTRLQQGIVNGWEKPLIAPERTTIATLLKRHGYRTACVGKWHLGWEWGIQPEQRPFFAKPGPGQVATDEHRLAWRKVFSSKLGGGPLEAGFESYFGTDVPNWPPFCFIEDQRTVGIPADYLPEQLIERKMASVQGPALPGWRFEDVLPTLRDRVCTVLTNLAGKPEPFFVYFSLTSPHTPLAVNDDWKGRSGLNSDVADLVMETDAAVGRVLTALEQSGVASNTIVLFTSDNGFAPYVGAKELEAKGHFPSGPLRGHKFDVWEGGHRIPFGVRWPGVVKAGTTSAALVHQADILATVADLIGAPLEPNEGEDSFSLLPLLKGSQTAVREHAVSCAGDGVPSLRQGPWKLVLAPDQKKSTDAQLFNLAVDLAETNNLAAVEVEKVASMKVLMERIVRSGRSTPGPQQKNDVRVRRYPAASAPNSNREPR